MSGSIIPQIGARFGTGLAACIGAGYLAFRGSVFRGGSEAFQVIPLGILAAAILALGRTGRWWHAMAVAAGYGIFRLGWIATDGWLPSSAGLVLGFGLVVVAVIFELLGRKMLFGKFLVVGPLVGGVFLAAAPLEGLADITLVDAAAQYMRFAFVGLIVGDGVGLGVEVADLLLAEDRGGMA